MQSNVWLQTTKSYVRIGGREVTDMKITEKFNKIFDKKIHLDLKKKDWALIGIVLCVAGLAFLLHEVVGGSGAGSVVVKVEGEIEGVYDLSEDQEIEINGGTNILMIKGGKADMIEADCPDQLCVHQKAISRNHESIICLPNQVVAEVESAESSEYDAVAQ